MKTIMTVSSKWNEPQIETTVWKRREEEGDPHVLLRISLDNFIEALKQEFLAQGKITWITTEAEFRKRMDVALKAVVGGIKYEWLKHPD